MTLKRLCTNKIIVILLSIFVFMLIFHSFFLSLSGEFLVKSDKLNKADLIIVLGGERGERVRFGKHLYNEGYADKMLLSGGPIIHFPGGKKITWASEMKEYAIRLGIPAKAIILQEKSHTTFGDATYSYQLLKDTLPNSIILVTSPYHSKRAFSIFKKVFVDVNVYSVPVTNSWFKPNSWWKSKKARHQVLREYFALLLYYLECII